MSSTTINVHWRVCRVRSLSLPERKPVGARSETNSPVSEPVVAATRSSAPPASNRIPQASASASVHHQQEQPNGSVVPDTTVVTPPALIHNDSQIRSLGIPDVTARTSSQTSGRDTVLPAEAIHSSTKSQPVQPSPVQEELIQCTNVGSDAVPYAGETEARKDSDMQGNSVSLPHELSACLSKSSGDSLLQRLGTSFNESKDEDVNVESPSEDGARQRFVTKSDAHDTPSEVQPAIPSSLSDRSYLPNAAISPVSRSESAVVPFHYRAVTVCAVGVAVTLFFVVMRRLALMLHDV